MKARDLLRAVENYSKQKFEVPEHILREVPEEQFRLMVYASAELFKTLKTEAIRRGIWDDLKTKKL